MVVALDHGGEGPVFDSWLAQSIFLIKSGLCHFTISSKTATESKGLLEKWCITYRQVTWDRRKKQ